VQFAVSVKFISEYIHERSLAGLYSVSWLLFIFHLLCRDTTVTVTRLRFGHVYLKHSVFSSETVIYLLVTTVRPAQFNSKSALKLQK